MRGTWQTTGGPDWGPAATVIVAAVLVAGAVAWLAARPWWELAAGSAVLAAAAAGYLRVRFAVQRAKSADLARIARIGELRADVNPQAIRGTAPAAVEQHVHYHIHGAVPEQVAAAIRAIPGTAGDAITGGRK